MAMSLVNKRERVMIPFVHEMPWENRVAAGGVPGPLKKTLSTGTGGGFHPDPDFPVATRLSVLPPGWVDPELVYHPCVEEGYVLQGGGYIANRSRHAGTYLYRPPGILHGPAGQPPYEHRVMIQRFGIGEGALLRYDGDEFPHSDGQPVTEDHKTWPVTWVEILDAATIPWVEVTAGPWKGVAHKWLSRNRVTGGGTTLLSIPPRWYGPKIRTRGTVEHFVVQGQLTMCGQWFEQWGYACLPAGEEGDYASAGGAELICFWDEDELTA